MNLAQQFWWLLTIFAIGWYLTVTVYVAIRGALDIRQMLARLESQQSREE
jgi:hypothetical protein